MKKQELLKQNAEIEHEAREFANSLNSNPNSNYWKGLFTGYKAALVKQRFPYMFTPNP